MRRDESLESVIIIQKGKIESKVEVVRKSNVVMKE
jgi:hypothetical protein